ncbi:MAG: hypothetical protein AVDCRST_MAG74-2373 [uncultured Pyrinomonadaceae bacterium]|uniref:DUF692 domain-containing protein n=1 Tax=uncultured Pyrinomonadaceae bacterium TaxID=2283094 RepID=A0A6J4PCH9_9BACT|nr:MAG: hypothetical protein AVDCRST_MAG74-2373 [uncultured Pyrinomonadaceae bacterium]
MKSLPKLGIGIGFREQFRADVFLHQNKIDFLEITADHYFDANRKKLEELELLKQHFPLIPHGLDLSLGSAEGVDAHYLEKFADLVEKLNPAWFSEHLCFTKSGGRQIGHLAPVPYTDEAVKVFVSNITRVKAKINAPLILENITYNVRFPSSEMSEAKFITKILEETDCGLLLDITNLYINSVNHRFDWRVFLDELPSERIVQLHFVGLHKHEKRLIDAHAHKTGDEIWEVFREVCQRADVKGAILERDENLPPFTEILEEIETAKSLFKNPNLKELPAV